MPMPEGVRGQKILQNMDSHVEVNRHTAETIRIDHPTASYGIFCYNSIGDLFLNSDWGMYGYAWRAFGVDFKKFLASANEHYIVGKFEVNYKEICNKSIPKNRRERLLELVSAFIKQMKIEAAKE